MAAMERSTKLHRQRFKRNEVPWSPGLVERTQSLSSEDLQSSSCSVFDMVFSLLPTSMYGKDFVFFLCIVFIWLFLFLLVNNQTNSLHPDIHISLSILSLYHWILLANLIKNIMFMFKSISNSCLIMSFSAFDIRVILTS